MQYRKISTKSHVSYDKLGNTHTYLIHGIKGRD